MLVPPFPRFTPWLATLVGLATGGFVCSTAAPAFAKVTELGPGDDVETAINAQKPGDELVLRGGTYTLTDAWHLTVKGTEAMPIVVRAKDGEKPHLHRPANDQNIIDFDDVAYIELHDIEFSGGSAGLRFLKASYVTVQDCEVHDTADVAINANSGGDYSHLRFLHNHIHDTGGTGEGMYIGCNDNGCQVHDSVFEGNHIHNTNGPNVSQGDGIEIKEGSYANVVRDNVIHDTGYPCIITYSTVGNGAPNVIERNLLYNCGDHGIQSAADVVIRNNIILGSAANGIANQPHQAGTPANIQILHNTILHPTGDAISSSGITGSVVIANNAVYSQNGRAIRVAGNLGAVIVEGNVGQGALEGVSTGLSAGTLANSFVAASYSGMPPNDVFPRPMSVLIGKGSAAHSVMDDFNGTPRNGNLDVGAYVFDASGNPGWPLGPGFKDPIGATPGDGGVGAGGSGAGGTGSGGKSTGGVTSAGGKSSGGTPASGGTGTGGTRGSGGAGAAPEIGGNHGDAGDGLAPDGGAATSAAQSSGCGCRTASAGGNSVTACLGAIALALTARRRRSRAAKELERG